MASAPVAPIRQPRGPSSNSFGAPPQQPSNGPPAPDSDSLLRRHNTVSTPRHQPSASVSANSAASSAFHGSRGGSGVSRFRSGSLSSGTPDPGLIRKGSGREVRKEQVVPEHEEGSSGMEGGAWGNGLSRQSSLPSRRAQTSEANAPPPRPPRRISVVPPSVPPAHMPSHSLSSLTMLPIVQQTEDQPGTVSRTKSLRAQAKHADAGGLGRSTSLKAVGEHHRLVQATAQDTRQHPLSPPTPPPASSTAALPPFQLPGPNSQLQGDVGGDLKRHQSLTQGYGSSNRVRERLERSPAILTLEQREEVRRRMTVKPDESEHPPISPIVPSVWSPSIPAGQDDGWGRAASQQLQDAFDAMNLGRRMMGGDNEGVNKLTLATDVLRHPPSATLGHEEPSWVTSLVGGDHTPHAQSAGPGTRGWQDREVAFRQQHSFTPQPNHFMHQPQFNYLQQQPFMPYGGMKQPFQGAMPYLGAPYAYPSPPNTGMSQPQASSNQDRDVIELAKQKGLNPATYDCQPNAARFFVIKSYTEEDVQKSLKHEIWSSTVLGNKRLDNAFRESADKGPIFLFFSVNGSRHFCGVAQMLTPVDESQNSTVWAQDKWKGIFKVKWIFVRDVPSQALRHIRLTNTPENKPITNSRDTQELPYEAGCEVLEIFLDHQTKSKTSLLQDFAYYERLSANRAQQPPFMPPMPAMQMPPVVPPVPSIPARFR